MQQRAGPLFPIRNRSWSLAFDHGHWSPAAIDEGMASDPTGVTHESFPTQRSEHNNTRWRGHKKHCSTCCYLWGKGGLNNVTLHLWWESMITHHSAHQMPGPKAILPQHVNQHQQFVDLALALRLQQDIVHDTAN